MGHHIDTHSIFGKVVFKKTGAEIRAKATAKVAKLRANAEARQARINEDRTRYGIDDAAMVVLLQAYLANQHSARTLSYSNSAKGGAVDEVEVGVIAKMQSEREQADNERQLADKTERVANNLAPESEQQLSYEDLVFLGF